MKEKESSTVAPSSLKYVPDEEMYHQGLSTTTGHQRDNVIREAGDTKAVLKAIAILNYPLEKKVGRPRLIA
ncbi:hypothetical protein N7451_011221 [Penicillium sp. IBT 35674x]|nr:hypothetical protein N7451_011221 [Penicillium sp. IBT 35674x]